MMPCDGVLLKTAVYIHRFTLHRYISTLKPVSTCSDNSVTSKHYLPFGHITKLRRRERELQSKNISLRGVRGGGGGGDGSIDERLMGEKTRWRGEEGSRGREPGRNVPKTLVVHLPLFNKVGQGQERVRGIGGEKDTVVA